MKSTSIPKVKLGKNVSFQTGKLNSNAANPNGKYPFFTCAQETFKTDTYSFDTECVLLGGNNANGIYPIKYFSGKFDAYQRTYVIRPLDEKILKTRYLYYVLQPKLELLKNVSTGAATKFLTITILNDIEVELPSLETQKKIVSILSAYDDLIGNNSRRIQILEEMARMIYQEWFVKFRFPGYERAKFVESPLGMIPEGWEAGTLKNFCLSTTYGYTASAQKDPVGSKFLRITDIVPDFIDWDNVPYCEISEKEETKYLLEEGDIVVARTGATAGYAKRLNKRHPKTVFASYLVRLRLSIKYASLYVGLLVESNEYKVFIKANASGAAQPQANAQVLTSIPVVMPPVQILQKFNSLAQPLIDQKEILEQKNMNLRRTRDLLLPKLIVGQIDVSGLDIQT